MDVVLKTFVKKNSTSTFAFLEDPRHEACIMHKLQLEGIIGYVGYSEEEEEGKRQGTKNILMEAADGDLADHIIDTKLWTKRTRREKLGVNVPKH